MPATSSTATVSPHSVCKTGTQCPSFCNMLNSSLACVYSALKKRGPKYCYFTFFLTRVILDKAVSGVQHSLVRAWPWLQWELRELNSFQYLAMCCLRQTRKWPFEGDWIILNRGEKLNSCHGQGGNEHSLCCRTSFYVKGFAMCFNVTSHSPSLSLTY